MCFPVKDKEFTTNSSTTAQSSFLSHSVSHSSSKFTRFLLLIEYFISLSECMKHRVFSNSLPNSEDMCTSSLLRTVLDASFTDSPYSIGNLLPTWIFFKCMLRGQYVPFCDTYKIIHCNCAAYPI